MPNFLALTLFPEGYATCPAGCTCPIGGEDELTGISSCSPPHLYVETTDMSACCSYGSTQGSHGRRDCARQFVGPAELLAIDPLDNEQQFHQHGQIGEVLDKLANSASNFTVPTTPTLRPKRRKVEPFILRPCLLRYHANAFSARRERSVGSAVLPFGRRSRGRSRCTRPDPFSASALAAIPPSV